MYNLEDARYLVQYYDDRIIGKTVYPLGQEPYIVRNIVFHSIPLYNEYCVYCICSEGMETLSLRDLELVSLDLQLVLPSTVLSHLKD